MDERRASRRDWTGRLLLTRLGQDVEVVVKSKLRVVASAL
jgi:hypothetical protein